MHTAPDTLAGLSDRARRRIRPTVRLREGLGRVRTSWWAIGQSAVGGALAWELAVRLLGHHGPIFAAVAAIVCLSASALNRLRRVAELALGVTIGVGLGDLLVGQIGRGGWQLGLVVLLAMTIGLLFDGGALIVNQAALQAVFVAALPAPTDGYLGRWQDALFGGATALTIAFAAPADPRPAVRRAVLEVTHTVADAVRMSVAMAREADPDGVFAALELARTTPPLLGRWGDAVRTGEEISRLSPLRRRAKPEIAAHRRSLVPVDQAIRNVRVALRRVVAVIEEGATLPGPVLDRLDDVAGAFHTVPGALRDPDGEGGRRTLEALTALARRLDPDVLLDGSLSAAVVVGQLRSTVVDLLQITGMPSDDARALLKHPPGG